jgi:hypothetical protein|tara:strand:- start:907 stop:1521 length:615 start_codon:yes stop_codon:yes gene_type:complete
MALNWCPLYTPLKKTKMRFYLGFIITLVGGLISIGLLRDWIMSFSNVICDLHLDLFSILIIVIGLIISANDKLKQSKYLKKLEDEQTGRILKPKQRNKLLEDLKHLSKIKVHLTGIQGDRESIIFANTIKEVLLDSGWEVDGVWEDIINGGIGFGVTIRENSLKQNSIGDIINEAFIKNNIDSRVVKHTAFSPELIDIVVGSRP